MAVSCIMSDDCHAHDTSLRLSSQTVSFAHYKKIQGFVILKASLPYALAFILSELMKMT